MNLLNNNKITNQIKFKFKCRRPSNNKTIRDSKTKISKKGRPLDTLVVNYKTYFRDKGVSIKYGSPQTWRLGRQVECKKIYFENSEQFLF